MSSTPILDLEVEPPQPKKRDAWLPLVIGGLIGLAFGFLNAGRSFWSMPEVNLWLLLPAYYLAVAIHEFGHFAVSRWMGIDSGGLSVGPLLFIKSGQNWIFKFDRRKWLGGGFFKPLTGLAGFQASRFAWMVLGGPIASLLLLVSLCWFRAAFGEGEWNWAGTMFLPALFILAFCCIPYSAGLAKSDAARFWQLIRQPQEARAWMAIIAIQTEESQGVLPRDWDGSLFDELLRAQPTGKGSAMFQFFAYYRFRDQGQDELSLAHLERLLSLSAPAGKQLRQHIYLEAAYANAAIQNNGVNARAWRERARKLQKPESLDSVDAAIARCEGRFEDAIALWESAIAYMQKKRLDSGIARFAKNEWMRGIQDCQTHLRTAAKAAAIRM